MPIPIMRPYQDDLLNRGRRLMAQGVKRIIFQAMVGAGKGPMIGEVSRSAAAKGKRVLLLVHRRRLIGQLSRELDGFEVPHGVLMNGVPTKPSERIQVASKDTLISRAITNTWIKPPPADLVIVDECFPAGTLVDGRPIEDVRVGDFVSAFDENTNVLASRKVVRLYNNPAPERVIEITANGRSVVATENHPFWTTRGWVNANQIRSGDQLFGVFGSVRSEAFAAEGSLQEGRKEILLLSRVYAANEGEEGSFRHMQPLQGGIPNLQEMASNGSEDGKSGLLLRPVRSRIPLQDQFGDDDQDDAAGFGKSLSTHEGQESHADSRDQGEGVSHSKANRPQAKRAWWERSRTVQAREDAGGSNRPSAANDHDQYGPKKRLPEPLQARFGGHGCQGERGDRRSQPRLPQSSREGCQETGILGVARVDRVEIHEQGGRGRYAEVCPNGRVYNLEVDGEHTYLANGFAVHNCHNLPSKGYTDLADAYPDAYHMGFTATPARADGKGLGDFYKAMECCIPTSELIKYGHIVPVKAYAPNQIGRKSKKTKREIGGDPISHWLRLGENRPTIAFCKSVAASKWLMNAFLMAGVVAEHLDAHTDDEDRDAMLNRLATGETQVVTNCSCLTEGVNVPVASCLIMLRMAASYTFYIQMMGRVMRAAPGKTHAIVLDHSDSVPHHGFPDQDVRWELTTSETIEDRNKKDRKDGKLKKPIACPACGICYEGTITCPACGFMLPRKLQTPELKRQLLTEVPREEITPEDLMVRKERYWKSCLAIAAHKGGKCSMAGAMYKRNFGEWPSGSFRHAPRGSDWHRKVGDVFPQFLEARSA